MTEDKTKPSQLGFIHSSLPKRLRVFVLAAIFLVLATTGLCMLVAIKTFTFSSDLFSLWYSILAGPFSALWILPEEPNWVTIGLVNLLALFAHPIWPNRITMTLTFLAFASWLFWGMAVAFIEV